MANGILYHVWVRSATFLADSMHVVDGCVFMDHEGHFIGSVLENDIDTIVVSLEGEATAVYGRGA